MSRRLDLNQDFRNRQARHGLSVKDESEWMENDAAARWLRRNGNHAPRQVDKLRLLERNHFAENV
jgi:hypothetical protein